MSHGTTISQPRFPYTQSVAACRLVRPGIAQLQGAELGRKARTKDSRTAGHGAGAFSYPNEALGKDYLIFEWAGCEGVCQLIVEIRATTTSTLIFAGATGKLGRIFLKVRSLFKALVELPILIIIG